MTIEALKKTLTTECGLLSRIDERTHKCRVAVDAADRALDTAQAELKRDQVDAVFEERESPNPELRKILAGLQNALHHAQTELDAAREAQATQQAKVNGIESQLQSRELDAQRIAFGPALKGLYAAFGVLMATAAEIDKKLDQTGPADLTEILFPLRQISGSELPDYEKMRTRAPLGRHARSR
ncbi:MAG: hypothetical protein M3N41_05300 [Acidobacteriota bacterium]|nr:hypothetical protein [Acidobacteriota bacterium]